jgi:apolipoprotein N-acyltransferase
MSNVTVMVVVTGTPVPFGEYIPGRRIWEAIGLKHLADSFLPQDLSRGDRYSPVDGIGTPICFESTLPAPSRRFTRNGASPLVTVTNDAWFSGSSELEAHFAAAVFRAVENRRFILQASNGGISGIIDPWGKIIGSTQEEGVLIGSGVRSSRPSPYTVWGDIPFLALAGAGLALLNLRRKEEDGGGR